MRVGIFLAAAFCAALATILLLGGCTIRQSHDAQSVAEAEKLFQAGQFR